MELTSDQQQAITDIISFIHKPIRVKEDVAGILYAAAGCGKTFLTRVIAHKLCGSHRIAGVAPTHKARKVLDRFLNKNTLISIKTMTIAGLLNKLRCHSYIGTKRYIRGGDSKIHLFDLFLIDEASMINDNDVQLILNYAFEFKRKILFIGDKFQIPNPSQKYKCKDGIAYKRDSAAFDVHYKFQLTTNVRQATGNPIVELYCELRDAIAECREPHLKRKTNVQDGFGVYFYTEKEDWCTVIENYYMNLVKPLHASRIIAYTNDTVRSHNLLIRRLFKRGSTPEVGELLMGYNSLGWPEKIIENSQDYYIITVDHTEKHIVAPESNVVYKNISGEILTIRETDSEHVSTVFIPSLTAANNQNMLQDLVKRAEKVNRNGSTKNDFKKYCRLKNKLVFMENVYKYGVEVIGEGEFRTNNPLLFKSISNMIKDHDDGDRQVLKNKLSNDVTAKYGDILDLRVQDDKPLGASERLCDRYCVIEKDLDYGVCITAHKSQGSTFETVFIDETDFDKLHDYWSYNLDCLVDSSKEKTQLKYVACTRPTDVAHILYRNE